MGGIEGNSYTGGPFWFDLLPEAKPTAGSKRAKADLIKGGALPLNEREGGIQSPTGSA